ncbi:protein MpASLBD22 [Marchantia polymorpha subsp. ruderalis]
MAGESLGEKYVSKMLRDLPESSLADAVRSLYFEAEARIKDQVHGCSGELYRIQKDFVKELQAEILEEKIVMRPN